MFRRREALHRPARERLLAAVEIKYILGIGKKPRWR
jgi:hypothetical protein